MSSVRTCRSQAEPCSRTVPRKLTIVDGTPPNRFALGDLAVGDRCEEHWLVSESAGAAFFASSDDRAPVHIDDEFARELGFPQRIVHGMFSSLRFSRLLGMFLPGANSVIMKTSFDYLLPVLAGDRIEYAVEITHLSESGIARLTCEARRDNELCVKGQATCLLRAS